MSKKITTSEFIEKAKLVHGNKYDYSLVNYINTKTKVEIICPIHNVFWQTPHNHLSGNGCPKCACLKNLDNLKEFKRENLTTEEFVNQAKNLFPNYDYSKVNYININTKVEIICFKHGSFLKYPQDFLKRKQRCPLCNQEDRTNLFKEEFLTKANLIYGNKFDFSNINYVNAATKISFKCNKCGKINYAIPSRILDYFVCSCSLKGSKNEERIANLLLSNNIRAERQKVFKECKDINPLPFDFYLPELNTVIEFQGEQHYKPVKRFGGQKAFDTLKRHDALKREYCLKNGIKEIEIPYTESIEAILQKEGII